jgi:asparagine synthase (glutamine-hydrolysing)
MCGIAGVVSLSGNRACSALDAMTDALRHRGPDTSGAWSDERCGLGHRRLSIIDLSPAGRQPLANEDGTVRITFNGEIYNYRTLRSELAARGHRFRTQTDTETIVHAYEQWGTECVARLRGMFAFGIWDQRRRRLFLARDRAGKKPLFYTERPDRFLFASELQGLLADPDVPREVDLAGVDAYLSWGFVPAPGTAFRGIRKLPPAHSLTLDLTPEGPVTRVERYWRLRYDPKLHLAEDEAAEMLRERLTEAVRLRMVSDVPLGAFLSGGIDSSVVVGLMARLSGRRVKTFAIGYEEADFSELAHARRIAERWGTEHHELVVRPDALGILPALVRHYGEPFADASAIPTFHVSRITRASVTVALNGDGGDECFAGYPRYRQHHLAERLRQVPGTRFLYDGFDRSGCMAIACQLASRFAGGSHGGKSWVGALAKRALAVACDPARRYARWLSCFKEAEKQALYSGEMRSLLCGPRPDAWLDSLFAETAGLHPVDAAMAIELRSKLPYDLLVKVDVASMAHGLEARSPFLDHEVMELAARLPVDLKLRGKTAKYLLLRTFADLLPEENVRRPKMGFDLPIGRWFRGPLRELLCDSLLDERALGRGYFQPHAIRSLVTGHLEGRADHSLPLWNLLMLELWFREMLDRAPQPALVAS